MITDAMAQRGDPPHLSLIHWTHLAYEDYWIMRLAGELCIIVTIAPGPTYMINTRTSALIKLHDGYTFVGSFNSNFEPLDERYR